MERAEGCWIRPKGVRGTYEFCDLIQIKPGANEVFRIYWRKPGHSITYEFFDCQSEYEDMNYYTGKVSHNRKCSVRITDMDQKTSLGRATYFDGRDERPATGVTIIIHYDNGDRVDIYPAARPR